MHLMWPCARSGEDRWEMVHGNSVDWQFRGIFRPAQRSGVARKGQDCMGEHGIACLFTLLLQCRRRAWETAK